jgi:hypothetical protein
MDNKYFNDAVIGNNKIRASYTNKRRTSKDI